MIIKKDIHFLPYVSRENQNEEIIDYIIINHPYHIPQLNLSLEICWYIIMNNPLLLEYIPIQFQTENLCIYALNKNDYVLKFVKKMTTKIALVTIEINFNKFQ